MVEATRWTGAGEYAVEAGIVPVAAAGNQGRPDSVSYPAAYDEFLGVAATTRLPTSPAVVPASTSRHRGEISVHLFRTDMTHRAGHRWRHRMSPAPLGT